MARSAVTSAREGLSLLDALLGFSDAQLVSLLAARPDLATPPPKDLPALMLRASSWASVNACVVTLNQAGQQLLDALCLLPQPTTVPALVRLLAMDVDGADLNAALDGLVDLALVFRHGEDLRVHPQLESRPNVGGLGPPASQLLSSQTVTALEGIARRLGFKPGRSKNETVAAIAAAFKDPDVLLGALKGSPPGTAELATQLVAHPVGSVSSGTYFLRPTTPLGWLADRGLVVATDWETVVMPLEVGLTLRGGIPFPNFSLQPPAVRWQPVDATSVDGAGFEQAQRVVADIGTILDLWQEVPAKLLKSGGLGVREIRRAGTAIGCSETDTARLIEMAAFARLAGWDEETETAVPLPAYDDWLNLETPQRWMAVVKGWLAAPMHVNLAGAIGTNNKPIPPLLERWGEEPARRRRQLVLAALAEGGNGQSAEIESLVARTTWDAPTIWTGGPARPKMLVSWVREEAQMLGLAASGAVTGLGLLATAGRYDEAVADLAVHTPKITSQFVIQADLTAVATGPLPKPIRTELELMADLESSGAATVFRFHEQSLRRAYDGGRTAAQIVSFLEAHATKGVPQPLTYLVEDVARRHGRVRVGSATCYLRSDDPSLLAEILVARKAAKLGLRQLAPTVLTSAATPEVVIATLRDGGYLPAEEDGSGALVVRRRMVARATSGHAPGILGAGASAGGGGGGGAAAGSAGGGAGGSGGGGRPGGGPDLKALVRKIRAAGKTTNGSGSRPPAPPPPPPPPRATGAIASYRTPRAPTPDDLERPRDIVVSRPDITELVELCLEQEWMLRFEYVNPKGRNTQVNGAVFNITDRQITFGTLPGYGTLNVAISRIRWARVLTEAEEEAF